MSALTAQAFHETRGGSWWSLEDRWDLAPLYMSTTQAEVVLLDWFDPKLIHRNGSLSRQEVHYRLRLREDGTFILEQQVRELPFGLAVTYQQYRSFPDLYQALRDGSYPEWLADQVLDAFLLVKDGH